MVPVIETVPLIVRDLPVNEPANTSEPPDEPPTVDSVPINFDVLAVGTEPVIVNVPYAASVPLCDKLPITPKAHVPVAVVLVSVPLNPIGPLEIELPLVAS